MSMDLWWKEDEPKYKHDCNNCKFLGNYVGSFKGQIEDLYICVHERGATLIRRFGNDGSEYWSCPLEIALRFVADQNHGYVRIAIKRAIQDGIITPEIAFEALRCI